MNNDFNPNNFGSNNENYNATQNQNNDFNANSQFAQNSQPNVGNSFCNNCGNQLQPGEKFCTKCGADVTQDTDVRCEQCGAIVPKGTNFCNACGAPVNKTQKAFCQFCGEKYDEGEAFCKKCGNKITQNNFFGNFAGTKPAGGTKKNDMLIKDFSNPITRFSIISIALVVLMFIFAFTTTFSFKMSLNKRELKEQLSEQYDSDEIDEMLEKYEENIEDTLEESEEELNDEAEMNHFKPFDMLDDKDYDEMIESLEESIEDAEDYLDKDELKSMKKLLRDIKFDRAFSIIASIVNVIAFIGMLALLILPLVNVPVKFKIAPKLPIIYAVYSLVYTIIIILLSNSLFTDLMGAMGNGYGKVMSVTTWLSVTGWIYVALAVALIVVSVLTNKKRKELKMD